jgi:hypothetical protein
LAVAVAVRLSEAVVVLVSLDSDRRLPMVVEAVTVLLADSVVVELDVPVSQLPITVVVRVSDALVELVSLKAPLPPPPPPPRPPKLEPSSISHSPA